MDYPKVSSGDPVVITADVWNSILSDLQQGKSAGPIPASDRRLTAAPAGDVVTVRNDTGQALMRGSAVGLNDLLAPPTPGNDDGNDSNGTVAEFMRIVVMKTATISGTNNGPGVNDVDAGFGVTIDAIPMGQFGRVMVSGVVQCYVNVQTATDKYVTFNTGNPTPNTSGAGVTRLIWVAGLVGSATTTGKQWAIVRLGGGGAVFPDAVKYMVWQQLDDIGTWGAGFARMH